MVESIEKSVAIQSAWMILEGLGFDRARNSDLERTVLAVFESAPAADVVPVRHGTWINADEQPYFRKHYHAKVCSECGKRKDGKWLYCPYCGSKNQDGGKDNG